MKVFSTEMYIYGLEGSLYLSKKAVPASSTLWLGCLLVVLMHESLQKSPLELGTPAKRGYVDGRVSRR